MKKLMLPIAILLVVVGLAVTALLMGWLSVPGLSRGATAEPATTQKEEIGAVVKLSPLVINLKDEVGRSYLKTTIVLEVTKKNQVEDVTKMLSLLTDLVILNLGDKPLEDLKKPGSKEVLKQELLTKMNQQFATKTIKRIYFDEFLYE